MPLDWPQLRVQDRGQPERRSPRCRRATWRCSARAGCSTAWASSSTSRPACPTTTPSGTRARARSRLGLTRCAARGRREAGHATWPLGLAGTGGHRTRAARRGGQCRCRSCRGATRGPPSRLRSHPCPSDQA